MKSAPRKAATTPAPWSGTRCPSTYGTPYGGVFRAEIAHDAAGCVVLEISGAGAAAAFAHEAGGHRFQRTPENDKHGRRHTSTITVAVLPVPVGVAARPPADRDLEWQAVRGSGAGGQARNKTSNCCVLKHVPTGTMVRVETERSLSQNRATALRLLTARLAGAAVARAASARADTRRQQVGSGQRGDHRRVIKVHLDQVVDEVTGLRTTWTKYQRGHVDALYNGAD